MEQLQNLSYRWKSALEEIGKEGKEEGAGDFRTEEEKTGRSRKVMNLRKPGCVESLSFSLQFDNAAAPGL